MASANAVKASGKTAGLAETLRGIAVVHEMTWKLMGRLESIEAKLDALCEALAAEDAEGDDLPMTTLDGRTVRATGTAGEPM